MADTNSCLISEDTRKAIDEIVQSLEHRVFTLECAIADMKAKAAKG